MPSQAPTRGRPRDPAIDEAILDAAFALLAEHGYDGTSVEAIAQRAGVGKPAIYRRWPDGKAQLVVDALRRLRRRHDLPDTGSLRGDLVAMVGAAADAMRPHSTVIAGVSCRMREDAELATLVRDTLVAEERALWRALAERAAARGDVPALATELFCDLAPSLLHGRLAMTGEPVGDDFVADLVDHVLLPVLLQKNQEPR